MGKAKLGKVGKGRQGEKSGRERAGRNEKGRREYGKRGGNPAQKSAASRLYPAPAGDNAAWQRNARFARFREDCRRKPPNRTKERGKT